jgi:hypothetical protein
MSETKILPNALAVLFFVISLFSIYFTEEKLLRKNKDDEK